MKQFLVGLLFCTPVLASSFLETPSSNKEQVGPSYIVCHMLTYVEDIVAAQQKGAEQADAVFADYNSHANQLGDRYCYMGPLKPGLYNPANKEKHLLGFVTIAGKTHYAYAVPIDLENDRWWVLEFKLLPL